MSKKTTKTLLFKSLWYLLGRRNLVCFARFLTNESRLNVPNDSKTKGELMVIERALANATPRESMVFAVETNIGDWTKAAMRRRGSWALRSASTPSSRAGKRAPS